ncbi:MAG: TIGR02281 family clan AA aspartic protease [Desulfobacterales bacterium]
MKPRFFAIFAVLLLALLALNRCVAEPLTWAQDSGEILYALALTGFVTYLIAGSWDRLGNAEIRRIIRHGSIWIAIFAVFTVGYSYRFELAGLRDRVLGTLIPGRTVQSEPGKMVFQISPDGHFYIRADVDGVSVRFLADTGATDIVLSPKTARRLGFDPENLRFDRMYQTANGPGRGASVILKRMEIGLLRMENVAASVNEAEMRESLLGMRFFNRLKGYTVKDGLLTLFW